MRYFKTRSINFVMLGTIFLILSALLTSGSNVYYSSNVQGTSPFTFTFVSFLVTAVFFQLTLVGKPNKGNTKNSTHKKDLIGINFSTAGVFMCFYLALKYIEPAIVGAIEIGIGPIASLIIVKIFYKQSVNIVDIFTGIGALAGSLYLVITTLNGNSGIEFQSMTYAVIGLISASLSGVFASLAAIFF
ncbi:DMT family transporter [Halobacillus andaensis]|uniref:DMT family transporter n=1 Tax=Halobacillus andaensis TaxID=1176239 RepID=UPI003D735B50